MMITFIKQHLSNIWSTIHDKLSITEAELKRSIFYEKARISVVSLILLAKTLIWNKTTFHILNSPNLAELVVNELTKVSTKDLKLLLFPSDLSLLVVKILRAYN